MLANFHVSSSHTSSLLGIELSRRRIYHDAVFPAPNPFLRPVRSAEHPKEGIGSFPILD